MPCCVSCSLHVTASATCQQYWWERFPADGGAATTAYMFTFTDPAPANRDLLGDMVAHYNSVLGAYLGKQRLGQKVLVLCCVARKEQQNPHTRTCRPHTLLGGRECVQVWPLTSWQCDVVCLAVCPATVTG